jgi:thymidylate synthase (FAD)
MGLLVECQCTPQIARAVLPNCLATEIVVTANLRELRHILKLRTSKAAHPEMRALMTPLLEELKERIPVIFDDI